MKKTIPLGVPSVSPAVTGHAMIVTIDGPAGAGKSSVAKALAARLGFRFLDTGAMYRAVALAILERGWRDWPSERIAAAAAELRIEVVGDRVLLDGRDVSDAIRTPEVTSATHLAADNSAIREQLVDLQRRLAAEGDIVCEGRDQGTVAFPDAACKIFLTASAEERARRRRAQWSGGDAPVEDWDTILDQINERDRRDRSRLVGRLVEAADAVIVCSDGLAFDEVVEHLVRIVHEARFGARHQDAAGEGAT